MGAFDPFGVSKGDNLRQKKKDCMPLKATKQRTIH